MPSVDIFIPLMFVFFIMVYRLTDSSRTIIYFVGVRVLLVSLIIHLALRSWVWMLFPLFMAIVLIILLGLPHLKINAEKSTTVLRKWLWGSAFTLSILSLIFTGSFPIRAIPEPTGSLTVGTFSWDLHTERSELYNDETGATRSIRAQAWYPASATTEKSKWLGDGPYTSQGLAIDFGFPGFIFNHLRHVEAHAYEEAPLLEGSYPLVIISHGWSGFRQLHTDLAEELASQGYIVIGIEHTYGSVGTVFEDGTRFTVNREALPPRATTPDFLDYANALVNTYANDIISVLDDIEASQNEALKATLFQHIDLSLVTVVGHSTGGGAAVKVGLIDERVHAVIGLDAWVEPLKESELLQGLNIPSLLIRSEGWYISFNNSYLKTLIENSPVTPIAFQMNGTTHYDFGMVYMFSTLAPFIGLQGERGIQMPLDLNELVLNYLSALQKGLEEDYEWQNIPDVEALVFP
jgi:pimeloyl-ACP methyl ester carboxylesterase